MLGVRSNTQGSSACINNLYTNLTSEWSLLILQLKRVHKDQSFYCTKDRR